MKLVFAAAASLLALSSTSFAADAIVDAPYEAPIAPEVFSWSGAYVGIIGGGAISDPSYDTSGALGAAGVEIDGDNNGGGFVGGQIGYDWQVNNWVFGAVADIAYASVESESDVNAGGSLDTELNYLGTVRGRVGYAFDRTLIYGHGGFAYGGVETNYEGLDFEDETVTGYTVGAGVEHAFTQNLSAQLEYSFVDFGDRDLELNNVGDVGINEDLQFHQIKVGLNYRF